MSDYTLAVLADRAVIKCRSKAMNLAGACAELNRLTARIAELEAIVKRLPRWADGSIANMGDVGFRLWVGPKGRRRSESFVVGWDEEDFEFVMGQYWVGRSVDGEPLTWETNGDVCEFYPTRAAAAEAARQHFGNSEQLGDPKKDSDSPPSPLDRSGQPG